MTTQERRLLIVVSQAVARLLTHEYEPELVSPYETELIDALQAVESWEAVKACCDPVVDSRNSVEPGD